MAESYSKIGFKQQVEKNYKTNFYANVFDGSFFAFGKGFVSLSTILPLFVHQLTSSKFLVSMITAILMFASNLPQLFSARIIEGLEHKKKAVLLLGLLQRLPWLLLAILTYLLPHSQWLLVIFFFCWGLYSLGSGLVVPAWFDLLSKVIPVERRGKFFGYRTTLSSILKLIAASIAGYIISYFNFPFNFTILFSLMFISTMISYICLTLIKEPDYPIANESKSFVDYFKNLPKLITKNINFRNYLLSVFLIQFIGMAKGLFTVAGIERLALEGETASQVVGIFTVLLIASQTVTNILWGHISDKYGHKIVILFAAIFNATGVLIALFANNVIAFYLVFIFTGIALGGNRVSFMTIIPEFCSAEERPTYIGITNTIKGITMTCVSMLGGLLVDLLNYKVVFGITFIMISLGSLILFYQVQDPRFEIE
ncbi:arabinose efflux permease family protein [Halobacteroides halobius DSM 5150]|uniref:Arabinose efflux permease family protein n=1 Tax=Halobacteroides halobius (strain ATCC 35273 / DSM 5150 / MD-1) TaxID=748449 RepID=L0K9I1_HALHC|nr:MFS transporter [Halobacteroides halobius]AGB41671.1 arabinose efflux permease family protein [Halobacteroides halobius DSM 5150]